MIDEAMAKFCAERPASEVERIFSGAKVPASLVYSYTDMKDNPHFPGTRDVHHLSERALRD